MEYNRPVGNLNLERRVRKFAACLKCDFAEAVACDPAAFKKQVVRLLRRELPPGPGRPLSEAVTRATEMRTQVQPWSSIYRQCIPGLGELGPGDRSLAMLRLRTAVRARRHGRKQKKPCQLVPEKIFT